ncbi:hypothetical protein EZV62_013636 [Acer yangbiense]|uniref:Disease resistance R13L4/SHOC-2-like LRR domain-containing protein n=1 Tax=Acer yangbiense TaxID=1000413 RepID=A0A5C7HYM2_9ROSI|nr:hypothetical protein EZV62_013636 [Acer yangbiense]
MDSQFNFPVNALHEAKSWGLFKSIAGTSVVDHVLKPITLEVAKECGGMPIAIVTIVKAFKNQGENEWKNVLRELKTPSSKSFRGIAKEEIITVLRKADVNMIGIHGMSGIGTFVVDHALKPIALEVANVEICIWFGLIYKVNTMEEALCYIYIYTLVNKLNATSLLLNASKGEAFAGYSIHPVSERFVIHDVVCDVARLIAYQDQHVITVIDGVNPQFWAKYDMLRKCTPITLHNYGELPEDLPFVLHLVDMDLQELTTSLSCLVNLQALCLDRCELGDTTLIGNLKKLEILSFRGSDIEKLPEEMCQLTRLRLLNLTDCSKLSVIPPNLKGIEELELGEVPGVTNLLDALDRNDFPTLKHLTIRFDPHCSYIVESCDALPSLESLWVMDSQGLEEICNSPLGANALMR